MLELNVYYSQQTRKDGQPFDTWYTYDDYGVSYKVKTTRDSRLVLPAKNIHVSVNSADVSEQVEDLGNGKSAHTLWIHTANAVITDMPKSNLESRFTGVKKETISEEKTTETVEDLPF